MFQVEVNVPDGVEFSHGRIPAERRAIHGGHEDLGGGPPQDTGRVDHPGRVGDPEDEDAEQQSDHAEGSVFVSGTPEATPLTERRFDLLLADGTAIPVGSLPETPALAEGGLARTAEGDLRVTLAEDAEFTAVLTFGDGARPAGINPA